jgi:hypothetical protein
MRTPMRFITIATILLLSGAVTAESDLPELTPPPPPPPITSGTESAESLEPEITIIQRGETTIQEYRIGGRFYMIKVIPSIGKPYYLVDTDGDGEMDSRFTEFSPNLLIPHWVIFSW